MLIAKYSTIDFNHQVYFIEGRSSTLFAASRNRHITFIDLNGNTLKKLELGYNHRDISFSDIHQQIGLIDEFTGNLTITDFQGETIFEAKPAIYYPEHRSYYGFLACYFDEDDNHLWCAVRISGDDTEIQLRRIKDWKIIDRKVVFDTFGFSSFSFHSMNRAKSVILWVAAGQDGTQICWLKNNNEKIDFQEEPNLPDDPIPPTFSPSGSEFLTYANEETFYQFSYPDIKEKGRYRLELNEADQPGLDICYLNDTYALTRSEYGLIFLINTREKKIVEQLIIKNHEPQPCKNYHPKLRNDDHLATDIVGFKKFGNYVFFSISVDDDIRKAKLIKIPAEDILEDIR